MKVLEVTKYEAKYFINQGLNVYYRYGKHGELIKLVKDDCAWEFENDCSRYFVIRAN